MRLAALFAATLALTLIATGSSAKLDQDRGESFDVTVDGCRSDPAPTNGDIISQNCGQLFFEKSRPANKFWLFDVKGERAFVGCVNNCVQRRMKYQAFWIHLDKIEQSGFEPGGSAEGDAL